MKSGPPISRRDLLVRGSGAMVALAALDARWLAGGSAGERTLPWLDEFPTPPREIAQVMGTDMNLLDWASADEFVTPTRKFFHVQHYPTPRIDPRAWRLEIGGRVAKPRTFALDELRALPRQEVVFAMECAGNSGFPWFEGAVGNARWAGTPLAPLLQQAAPAKDAIEVVFFGADQGDVSVPYLDGDGARLGEIPMRLEFARSMSLDDALAPENLLCHEMNGEPLGHEHGSPLRLVAPGWYGVANVKWLNRIELRDRRFMGPYMSERYVTVREEPRADGAMEWTRMSVGRSRLKSIPGRVTERDGRHRIHGAAWGAPIARVEVRIDDEDWAAAAIDEGMEHDFAWKLWHLDWPDAAAGEHRITSRAVDRQGNAQPAPDDWRIARKRTYWESNGQITRRIRV